ncbi:Stealth CR1 domain-containing protein [Actimicrobium sp. CCI2.3]|uniref:Stealth CR1 domain-containing protein n=1 Tax=Actimicrobium sp. CCI2.3 TaxID=3048616 RepID=UPI002AB4992E|nr:Stealth CR1 domain-containing protein [Actimicrobium sp. CCI2.3]MDY7576251.1 Stealth CR1 domain-containing protein [Actimicrobium sp. CCI2.3]MEB0020545.1 Stealth CR1 domain-containing protein [Actimicrobium sp. CCI2.3]
MTDAKPIDIVYLWVDGNDPAWRRKRHRAAEKLSTRHRDAIAVYGNVEGRFRDNDELRYSLRALERFFPEHGHVYIVTDGQSPAWLRPSARVTIVDHASLIPATSLPTFDSGNIESYIHRIPNLSERFIYLNDDVFFGAPVHVSDWFDDNGICVAWSDEPAVTNEPLRQDATSLDNACRLSHQWLAARHIGAYQHTFRTFAHSPRPMLRSMMVALEEAAPDLFAMVRSTTFRTWDKPTIVSDFVMRWALAHGQATVRDYSHLYISTGEADQLQQIEQLVAQAGSVDFFCINDTTDDAQPHDPRLVRVRAALQQILPQASPFERVSVVDALRRWHPRVDDHAAAAQSNPGEQRARQSLTISGEAEIV